MDQPTATVLTGLATAIVTIGGWLAVHFFTRKRELEGRVLSAARADRTKRLEILMKHYERQVEEFYGPIYALIQLTWNVYAVRKKIVKELGPQTDQKMKAIIWKKYFQPIHEEVRNIIKTKLYLIEGADIPESYDYYLRHAMTEKIQNDLNEEGINTESVTSIEYSYEFADEIKSGLDEALRLYQEAVEELQKTVTA